MDGGKVNVRLVRDVDDGDDEADADSGSGDNPSMGEGDIASDGHDRGEWLDDREDEGDVLPVVHGDNDALTLSRLSRAGGRK